MAIILSFENPNEKERKKRKRVSERVKDQVHVNNKKNKCSLQITQTLSAFTWPTMDKNRRGDVIFPDQGFWGFQVPLFSYHVGHCDTGP